MAVKNDKKPYTLFNPVWSVLAGVFSTLFAAAGIGISLTHLNQLDGSAGSDVLIHIAWAAVFAFVIVNVIQMFRGKIGAHQTLLAFWLMMTLAGTMIGLNVLLSKTTPLWIQQLDVDYLWLWITGGSVVSVVGVWLLMKASAQRLRFASTTAVSITIAAALLITVNLIAQKDYVRLNTETLGRYTISPRTEKIIGGIDGQLKLTCVYTGSKEGQNGLQYRSRVLELLRDMSEFGQKIGKDIEVVNITTDLEKARMVQDLKGLLASQAGEHVMFLDEFTTASQETLEDIKTQKQNFSKPNRYLDQWGLSAELVMSFDKASGELEDLLDEIKKSTGGTSVVDYRQLTGDLRDKLQPMLKDINTLQELLGRIQQIPVQVNQNRTEAIVSLKAAQKAVADMAESLQKPNVINPTETISDYVAKAKLASIALKNVIRVMDKIAGEKQAPLLQYSSNWRIKMVFGGQAVRPPVGQVLEIFAETVDSHRAAIEKILVDKILAQSQEKLVARIGDLKIATQDLNDMLQTAASGIEQSIENLGDVDAQTADMLKSAAEKKLFAKITNGLKTLVDQADNLPDVPDSSVAGDLTQDNIVLIQTPGRTDVVSFEQVWPLAVRPLGGGTNPDEQRRVFNGDGAIGSKILELTHKPFGKVVLAYVAPKIPPQQMMLMQGHPPDPRNRFRIIRQRLEAANFEIEEWDLDKPLDAEKQTPSTQPDTKSQPAEENRVIVLLPPAGRARYTPVHLDNLKKQIDNGTPAVFLLAAAPRGAMDMSISPINSYLASAWNIKPLTDYFVINAIRDEADPTRFRLDDLKFQWAPYNNFTDHPVGRSLQAQRFLLSVVTCPLAVSDQQIPGVTVESILRTSPNRTDTWATGRPQELINQFQTRRGNYIKPNYDAPDRPDMPCPFDLVLAATQTEDPENNVNPNRIVVMALAGSLADTYLAQKVYVRDAKGTLGLAQAPTLNSDIVVNSVYWLAGLEKRIAAGPVVFKPINISDSDRTTCMIIFAMGLPAVVLAVGGLVMLKRSRS